MSTLDGLLLRAYREGVECTLVELRAFPDFKELGLMTAIRAIGDKIESEGLKLHPPIEEGEFDQVRVLARAETPESFMLAAQRALEEGESSLVEFKESLYLKKKLYGNASIEARHWVGEEIIFEIIATICSFLNGDGGTLLVGVNDDGEVIGIDCELEFIPGKSKTLDNWELFFSNCLEKYIYDFKCCLGYSKRKIIEKDGKHICVIIVNKRDSALTVCQGISEKDSEKVFVRNGNGKAEIKARAIEQLVLARFNSKNS